MHSDSARFGVCTNQGILCLVILDALASAPMKVERNCILVCKSNCICKDNVRRVAGRQKGGELLPTVIISIGGEILQRTRGVQCSPWES